MAGKDCMYGWHTCKEPQTEYGIYYLKVQITVID